jgi:hypothetical protein
MNPYGGWRSLPIGPAESIAFNGPQERQGVVYGHLLSLTVVPLAQILSPLEKEHLYLFYFFRQLFAVRFEDDFLERSLPSGEFQFFIAHCLPLFLLTFDQWIGAPPTPSSLVTNLFPASRLKRAYSPGERARKLLVALLGILKSCRGFKPVGATASLCLENVE